jgi:hypothetical protein
MLNKTAREQVAVDMRFRGIIYLEDFKKDATNPNRLLASRINLGGVNSQTKFAADAGRKKISPRHWPMA